MTTFGMLLSVGADPEVLLFNKHGRAVSVEGKLGGTKSAPRSIPGHPPGFTVQEDNVSAEFNIPPSSSAGDFAANIASAMRYINSVARKHRLVAKAVAAAHFDPAELMTVHAQTLGCDPDYNAWTKNVNPRPRPPETLRTAAGHVHIGYENPVNENQVMLVKMCDLFLGVPSVLATERNERRQLYGRAGAFRFKPYGVEYRSLDNFWVASREQSKFVFTQVQTMFTRLRSRESQELQDFVEDFSVEIQDCINNHDKDMALNIIEIADLEVFPHVN